jgi:lantibiotic modifying enzyme
LSLGHVLKRSRDINQLLVGAVLNDLARLQNNDAVCVDDRRQAGRILFLMEAANQTRRPELAAAARDAAQTMLNRFEFSGTLELQDFSERLTVPSLMGGMGAIALAFLWASGKPGIANPLTPQIK